jgi:hemerythrin superfamily protein
MLDKHSGTDKAATQLLADDHADLGRLIKEVFIALEGRDAERVFQSLDLFWARLAMHIRAEHLHLFPGVLNALRGDADQISDRRRDEIVDLIAHLRQDHDFYMKTLATAVNVIRHLPNDSSEQQTAGVMAEVRERLDAVVKSLEQHDEAEEQLIYELPQTLLTEAAQSTLAVDITRELENLPPRFSTKTTVDL